MSNKIEINGHFHCPKDEIDMTPLVRIPWDCNGGVGCIYMCKLCGKIIIEKEYGGYFEYDLKR